MTIQQDLEANGWTLVPSGLSRELKDELRGSLFQAGVPGTRCLLDEPAVAVAAAEVRKSLCREETVPDSAVAIQAIAFDKSSAANWKVPWHQDLMFPVSGPVEGEGYTLHSRKDGIDFARPPREVLDELLAVRLHLDDCGPENGPLRVCPGSHRSGIVASHEISGLVARCGEVACVAREGDLLLMKPLLLHASSRAVEPRHRRVLHLVFHSGGAPKVPWHRVV